MKILDQRPLQAFQTKKKLSNAKSIHWIVSFLVVIGMGYLFILVEFFKMHDRKMLFYNLKTVNLLKQNSISLKNINEKEFNNNSPVFIIYKDKIIFGTLSSVLLPKLKKDNLVFDKNNFIQKFKEEIKKYKNKDLVFPANNIGIAFSYTEDYSSDVILSSKIFSIMKDENKKYLSNKNFSMNPSVIFIDSLPEKL